MLNSVNVSTFAQTVRRSQSKVNDYIIQWRRIFEDLQLYR